MEHVEVSTIVPGVKFVVSVDGAAVVLAIGSPNEPASLLMLHTEFIDFVKSATQALKILEPL